MNEGDQLISIWKSNKSFIQNNININSSNKINNTMDTIIQFESKEKSEKNNQIFAAVALTILTIIFLYGVELTMMHCFGIILLLIGVAYNIIANRTDNFPDFRQLSTVDYLKQFKDNTLKRNRMHRVNLIIGLIFLVPGCYLTYRDSFPELGDWWMPIMMTSASITGILWFVKYNKRSNLVLEKVTKLIDEFKNEE